MLHITGLFLLFVSTANLGLIIPLQMDAAVERLKTGFEKFKAHVYE
jgi:hypothetical protein